MERFSFIFLVAGLGFFALAFGVSAYLPMLPVADLQVATVEQLAANPPIEFAELREQYPEAFIKAFGDQPIEQAFAQALRLGHKTYVGEACWHCHSQQVRPWGEDEARFGRISYPEEYHNKLNMPPLWGTRRIGPDLIREGGRQSNDWHVAHFWKPTDVAPLSVMPEYPWFFEADGLTPNKVGLSLIAYIQWLGSWEPNIRETVHSVGAIERQYDAPQVVHPGAVAKAVDAADAQAAPDDADAYGADDTSGHENGEEADYGY